MARVKMAEWDLGKMLIERANGKAYSFWAMNEPKPPTAEERASWRQDPMQPVVLFQKWRDLAFLHWSFPPDEIKKTLPEGLALDTFHGKAWVGIIPLFMKDVHPRFVPAMPLVLDIEKPLQGIWLSGLVARRRLCRSERFTRVETLGEFDGIVGTMQTARGLRRGAIFMDQRWPVSPNAQPVGVGAFHSDFRFPRGPQGGGAAARDKPTCRGGSRTNRPGQGELPKARGPRGPADSSTFHSVLFSLAVAR